MKYARKRRSSTYRRRSSKIGLKRRSYKKKIYRRKKISTYTRVHNFKFEIKPATPIATSSVAQGGQIVFNPSVDLSTPQQNILAGFQFFRIARIKVKFIPRQNAINSAVPGTNNLNPLWTLLTKKKNSTINVPNLAQAEGVRCTQGWQKCTYYFKPYIYIGNYDASGLLVQTYPKGGPWLATADFNMDHFGVDWGIAANGAGTTVQQWDLQVVYYIQTKGVLASM